MASRTRNPRNPTSNLFKRLTRIFSGPIVNYRRQTERALRRRQLNKYKFTSTSGQQFQKAQYNPFESLQSETMAQHNRAQRYADFNQMEFCPEINSSLDVYADEMTTSTPMDPLLNIKCPNEEIKDILHGLFYDVLNIEHNVFGWARTMCKFGDQFLYLDIDEDMGIKHIIGLPPAEVERLEGEDKTNPNYIQFLWTTGQITFENWQIAHFRILGNDKHAPYGTAVLDAARRIWRQLTLIEDAMMAYRIVRSPERRVFYIDVGNISPTEVKQYMERVVTEMKRHQVVDPETGRVDLRYNPMSIEEDYFIPVRGGNSSRIDTLQGGQYTGDIDDVKYLRDKLFSALKVPMSYLARGEGADEDKTTLAQKDIRFARTITRLQRAMVSELNKIATIHLYILGYRGEDLLSFELKFNNPSKIAEMQELEHWRLKFDVASAATEGYFSRHWIGKNIFGLSDEDIHRNIREMYYDRMLDAELEALAQAPEGEGGGGGFGDLEGGGDGGDLEGGGDDGGADEGGADDDSMLLAAPAKRDDAPYTTPGSNGKKYTATKTDKRRAGARRRSYRSQGSHEMGTSAHRNLFKGGSGLAQLARGISEGTLQDVMSLRESLITSQTPIYDDEEEEIFRVNNDIKQLSEVLGDREDEFEVKDILGKVKKLKLRNKNEGEA